MTEEKGQLSSSDILNTPISRRKFLRIVGAAGASALLSSCGIKSETTEVNETPVATKENSPTSVPIPEATGTNVSPTTVPTNTEAPTVEITKTPTPTEKILESANITAGLMKEGFFGIGGSSPIPTLTPDILESSPDEPKEALAIDIFSQASESWNWDSDFTLDQLAEDPQKALEFAVYLVAFSGYSGTTANITEMFPGFHQPFRLFRYQIENLSESDKNELTLDSTSPINTILRNGTGITVAGKTDDGRYLIAFEEWFDRKNAQRWQIKPLVSPRLFWASVDRQTLEYLVGRMGNIKLENDQVVFADKQENTYRWEINTIDKRVNVNTGFYWADTTFGILNENPVVPEPSVLPDNYTLSYDEENGVLTILNKDNVPSLEARYHKTEKKWIWEKIKTKQELAINAPVIEGLSVGVEDNKVVYRAEEGNRFGLEAGQWAGELRPEVMMGENKTGGLVLNPIILEELWIENLGTGVITVPIPEDIRGVNSMVRLSSIIKGQIDSPASNLLIEIEERVPVVSIFPGKQKIGVSYSPFFGITYYDTWRLVDPLYKTVLPGQETRYVFVAGDALDGLKPETTIDGVLFGQKLAEGRGSLYINISAANDWVNIAEDNIYRISGIPIFIAVRD